MDSVWILQTLGEPETEKLFSTFFPLCVCAHSVTLSCSTLCDLMDYSWSGSSVHGIFQARILEWVAIPFTRGSSQIKDQVQDHVCVCSVCIYISSVAQSCPTLSDPMDRSLPGSSVHGIFQARVLEWGAIAFSASTWTNLRNILLSERWKWNHSVVSDSSRSHGLQPISLLCPWDFPGKSTGVGVPLPSPYNLLLLCQKRPYF